jgi:RimJ/RimL family protein N-acetyltransferase
MAHHPPIEFTSLRGRRLTIRSATEEDAEALITLASEIIGESVWSLTQSEEFSPTAEEEKRWIQQYAEHPRKLLLVAEADGHLIGNLSFACGAKRLLSHLGEFGMGVRKGWRGEGVGRRLLEALLLWAPGAGIERVKLSVHATNQSALALYAKLGFVEEGRQVRELKYGPDLYVDSISMARDLTLMQCREVPVD